MRTREQIRQQLNNIDMAPTKALAEELLPLQIELLLDIRELLAQSISLSQKQGPLDEGLDAFRNARR